jgi:hypothetical protein
MNHRASHRLRNIRHTHIVTPVAIVTKPDIELDVILQFIGQQTVVHFGHRSSRNSVIEDHCTVHPNINHISCTYDPVTFFDQVILAHVVQLERGRAYPHLDPCLLGFLNKIDYSLPASNTN